MVTGINESKILTKHILYECKCINFMVENVTRIKSEIMIKVDVSAKIQKNIMHVKKIISGTLLNVVVKMLNI